MATNQTQNLYFLAADATHWEPFEGGTVLEGEPNRKIQWLRADTGDGVSAGLFTADPCRIGDYTLELDELIYVIEGHVRIELEGEVMDVGPGDSASLRAGTTSVWTITEPFKEFFVFADPRRASA